MSYIGDKPSQTLASPTSQYFNGTGSATVFTLNRAVNVSEDLEVFVNNIQQEPGVGKSYTATGTTLTFDAPPSLGTGNVYVVYRGLAEVTTRLEHDPNAALAATTGTFSGAISGTTGTFSGNVGINTSTFENTNGTELNIKGGTNNTKPAVVTMQGASGDGAGFVQTEVFGIANVTSATEITRITGTGANGMRMLIYVTVTGHTGALDNGHSIGRYYWNGATNSVVTIELDVNSNGFSPVVSFDTSTSNVCIVKLTSGNGTGAFNGVMEVKWYVPIDFASSTWTVS